MPIQLPVVQTAAWVRCDQQQDLIWLSPSGLSTGQSIELMALRRACLKNLARSCIFQSTSYDQTIHWQIARELISACCPGLLAFAQLKPRPRTEPGALHPKLGMTEQQQSWSAAQHSLQEQVGRLPSSE